MSLCWRAEPKDRPDFMEIADIIGALLESNVRQHYLDLNDPYQDMNEQILNNNDYLRMSSMHSSSRNEINDDYLNMKVNETDGERKSDPLIHYDNLGDIRPIDANITAPVVAMETVPMIQLDSYGQRYDEKNWIHKEGQNSDYLTMNLNNSIINKHGNYSQTNHNYSSDSSDVCFPPPYSHVI
ncbi:unnamed protein product [Medioppia subpectinata]|uniref:Uncharacterized protein n=1 Tax=Medioppia subpectinata TaxID=1979941 RepID=A0A7R9KXT4_9ACAR|nr:unnamed protein product [Medioppia subpectinata]CAG2111631.1 unnamed protein product [Medioppia subpectinata]